MGRVGPHPEATARTTDEARAGRSAREWRVVNDPAPAVEATKAVLAEGGETAERFFRAGFRSGYAAYTRRDWELNTLFIDAEDCVFRPAGGHEMIDVTGDFRGIAGYLEAQDHMLVVWADMHVQLLDLLLPAPDSVITTIAWRGRAARSGIEMEWLAVVDNRFRDGLCVGQTFWWDRQRAERDLGFALPATGGRR